MATSFASKHVRLHRRPPSVLGPAVRRPPSVLSDRGLGPDLIGLHDAAGYLALSIDQLMRLVDQRRILHYEVASRPMFDPIELDRWTAVNRSNATPSANRLAGLGA